VLLQVENLLTPDVVVLCNQVMDKADWIDGRITAGYQSERVKHNLQLPEDSPEAHELGKLILSALLD
jgi:PKHD-type hydroxylase